MREDHVHLNGQVVTDVVALDIGDLEHGVEPCDQVEYASVLVGRRSSSRDWDVRAKSASGSLTIPEVLQQRLDPLKDDIQREQHTTDRVEVRAPNLLTDPLRESVLSLGLRRTGKDRDTTLSHTSFSAS